MSAPWKFICTAVLLLSAVSWIGKPAAQNVQSATMSRFAYTYQNTPGSIQVGFVDPYTIPLIDEFVSLQLEQPHWSLAQVASSVGNEWIAIGVRSGPDYTLRLVHTTTFETRDIASHFIFALLPGTLAGPQQEFLWSSDGRFLVWNIFQPGSPPQAVTMLYNVQTDTVSTLIDEAAQPSRLSWSNDGRQLAVVMTQCDQVCSASIDIFDPYQQVRTRSFAITPPIIGAAALQTGVCHLNWSPDDRYLTFMAVCDTSAYASPKELFLLELETAQLTQLTDFTTSDAAAEPGIPVFANYTPVWLDDSIILISVIYGIEETRSETLQYHISTHTQTQISSQFVTDWAFNRSSASLAYQSLDASVNINTYETRRREMLPVDLTSIEQTEHASASVYQPTVRGDLPAGCDLRWSPDGALLAYSVPRAGACGSPVTGFVFVREEDGTTFTYTPDFSTSEPFIMLPIGWVSGA
jgi:hypothetical protein